MSLPILLLGLTRKGATGFSIKRAFQEGLHYIWDAELSQIYPTLHRLEKLGLLSSVKSVGGRGSSRIYTLTKAGERKLEEWLRSEPVFHDERHPFLVQLCLLGDLADPGETLRYLAALNNSLSQRLRMIEQLEEQWRRHDPCYPELASSRDFHFQMALEFGLSSARAALATCERCIRRTQKRKKEKRR